MVASASMSRIREISVIMYVVIGVVHWTYIFYKIIVLIYSNWSITDLHRIHSTVELRGKVFSTFHILVAIYVRTDDPAPREKSQASLTSSISEINTTMT